MLSRFHLIPERYGRTDRRTDRQICYINIAHQHTALLTRDKNDVDTYTAFWYFDHRSLSTILHDSCEDSLKRGVSAWPFASKWKPTLCAINLLHGRNCWRHSSLHQTSISKPDRATFHCSSQLQTWSKTWFSTRFATRFSTSSCGFAASFRPAFDLSVENLVVNLHAAGSQQVRWFVRVLDKWNVKNPFRASQRTCWSWIFVTYFITRAYHDVIKWKKRHGKAWFYIQKRYKLGRTIAVSFGNTRMVGLPDTDKVWEYVYCFDAIHNCYERTDGQTDR